MRERDAISQRLTRVQTLAEFGGPLVAFCAPRGLGKTSLLRNALEEATASGFVPVWVAAAQRTGLLPELVHNVRRALERQDAYAARARGWPARLAQVEVEIGLPGAKVAATFEPGSDRDGTDLDTTSGRAGLRSDGVTRSGAPIALIQDLLVDTAELVRSWGAAGLAVFIDEVHAAPTADLAIVLNALQNISGERYDRPLAVFAAGLPSTPTAFTRAATFGERTAFLALDPLTEPEAADAIVSPALDAGVSWESEAVRVVISAAKGNPYLLQLYGYATWETLRPEPGATVGPDDARRGLRSAGAQMEAMFEARWNAATPLEQQFVLAMLAEMTSTGADRVSRSQVARAMSRSSGSLAVPRSRLVDKGIVESAGRGFLRFVLPGFADYVTADQTDHGS